MFGYVEQFFSPSVCTCEHLYLDYFTTSTMVNVLSCVKQLIQIKILSCINLLSIFVLPVLTTFGSILYLFYNVMKMVSLEFFFKELL